MLEEEEFEDSKSLRRNNLNYKKRKKSLDKDTDERSRHLKKAFKNKKRTLQEEEYWDDFEEYRR